MNSPSQWPETVSKYFSSSIRNKIIIPYAVLTVVLAVLGVFVVTNLVAGSFEERLKNQLLEAGRVVSNEVVNRERVRLEVQRAVANTEGVNKALVDRDLDTLNQLISPFVANYKNVDSVVLVDAQGKEVLRLQRESLAPNAPAKTYLGSEADFWQWSPLQRVLAGANNGAKEIQIALDPNSNELIIYTIGPVQTPNGIVGAALVGTYLKKELDTIHNLALADVTLFDQTGEVVYSTLVTDNSLAQQVFSLFTPERYQQVIQQKGVTLLDEIEGPDEDSPGDEVETRGERYRLAYAPFLLRDRIYGVYSVALPTNFITETNSQSRNILALIFAVGVVMVIGIGFLISQRIIRPIIRLVQTSQAIAQGDLDQRTGLQQADEIGILATTFDDMTGELQRLLKMQREEASKLNAILSSIADGVIVQDMAGHTIITNPAAADIMQTIGDNLALTQLLDHPESAQKTNEASASSLLSQLTGLAFHQTHRFEVGSRTYSALSAPVVTAETQQLGTVVVLRDITREVESEKLKDDFITSVSHELRTPLTAIKGYNDLLRMTAGSKLDERQLNFIETIDQNVSDLLDLIQQMLDLSQISAGNLGIDQEPVNLTDLITTEAEQWADPMTDKELTYTLNLPYEVVWVEGDYNRLIRVIGNLIRNAHDYTLPGGHVEVRLRSENGLAQVDVQDTGVGITPENQRFLFTRFFRAIHEESTYEVSGAGLGLYISKAIIEAHGGKIWLESQPNQGSTFSFSLSVITPPADEVEFEPEMALQTER
jgi:signal transduction histidine kinase